MSIPKTRPKEYIMTWTIDHDLYIYGDHDIVHNIDVELNLDHDLDNDIEL